ncbi:MAG: hypothetical protein CEN87_532 [Parcubacteria group bacterium Licking1014_1]|nr:MAG: hypothetical protein CEN87_532 [Parcubacteria group bacterium Licking1014_1]
MEDKEKSTVEIPEKGAEMKPGSKFEQYWKKTESRFNKIDNLMFAIVASVVVAVIAVVISVISLFVDQMRYNNAAYKDYSNKIEINNNLLKDIKENQNIIKEFIDKSNKK